MYAAVRFPALPEIGFVISGAGTPEEKRAIEVKLLGSMLKSGFYP